MDFEEDEEAMEELCERFHSIMEDEVSLIAINKDEKQILGLSLNKIMNYEDFSWWVFIRKDLCISLLFCNLLIAYLTLGCIGK